MEISVSVAVVDCAVEIRRSAEDVVDYVTDISREFEWNRRTKRVVKPIARTGRFVCRGVRIGRTSTVVHQTG
jgi:hypothetical protein